METIAHDNCRTWNDSKEFDRSFFERAMRDKFDGRSWRVNLRPLSVVRRIFVCYGMTFVVERESRMFLHVSHEYFGRMDLWTRGTFSSYSEREHVI